MSTFTSDQNEIDKFSKMAEDWWNPTGKLKSLHDINPLRLQFIQNEVELKDKNLLDVGCGGGILTESLAKNGAHVLGIDLSPAVIHAAIAHAQSQNLSIEYQVAAVESLVEERALQFDIVTCMELLEHVPHPAQIIQACAQLTKPGGKLFFSTINRNIKSYLHAIVGAEYILKLLPTGTHDYAKLIRPSELAAWARAAGLSLKKIQGMSYNVLTHTYYFTKNIDVNYLVCLEKHENSDSPI